MRLPLSAVRVACTLCTWDLRSPSQCIFILPQVQEFLERFERREQLAYLHRLHLQRSIRSERDVLCSSRPKVPLFFISLRRLIARPSHFGERSSRGERTSPFRFYLISRSFEHAEGADYEGQTSPRSAGAYPLRPEVQKVQAAD